MRFLVIVIVLLLVVIASVGFYRGWFSLSMDNTDQQPSATFTMDKDKIQADEQKAKDKLQDIGQDAQENISDRTDKVKEPERQP